MTALTRRLTRVQASLPSPPPSPRVHDLRRLTAVQQAELERLSARYAEVGMTGLTDAEVEVVAELLRLLEGEEA